MTTPTAKWVRVRLGAPADSGVPALTDGELILRADRVEPGKTLVRFYVGDEEVFRLPRDYYRTHALFVDRPTFAEWLRERRANYPRQGIVWSPAEVERLRNAKTTGLDWAGWEKLAARFGRSVGSVQRKARQIAALDRPDTDTDTNERN
jgi:hypothetical protein